MTDPTVPLDGFNKCWVCIRFQSNAFGMMIYEIQILVCWRILLSLQFRSL